MSPCGSTAKFWRQSPYYYYYYVGAKTASPVTPNVKLAHSSYPKWRGYDTSVYGVNSGKYSIYGGTRGTSGLEAAARTYPTLLNGCRRDLCSRGSLVTQTRS